MAEPAVARLAEHLEDTEHPAISLGAVREVLNRNGLEAEGKPADRKIVQPPARVNVSTYHFEKLSDSEVEQIQ